MSSYRPETGVHKAWPPAGVTVFLWSREERARRCALRAIVCGVPQLPGPRPGSRDAGEGGRARRSCYHWSLFQKLFAKVKLPRFDLKVVRLPVPSFGSCFRACTVVLPGVEAKSLQGWRSVRVEF